MYSSLCLFLSLLVGVQSQFPPPPFPLPPRPSSNQQGFRNQAPQNIQAQNQNFNSQNPSQQFVLHEAMSDLAYQMHGIITRGESSGPCAPPPNVYPPVDDLVYSPFSIAAALSILWRGATGTTEQQLRSALRYPNNVPDATINQLFGSKLTTLTEPDRGVNVDFSSTLFGETDLRLIKNYFQDLQNFYSSSVLGVDFNDPQKAQDGINKWVRAQTKGRIPTILTQPPSPNTKLIMANAIYFKGNWEFPFNEEATRPRDFTVNPGEIRQIPMMYNIMSLPHVKSEQFGAEMIGLPYEKGDFGFFIILPLEEGEQGLRNWERSLSRQAVDTMISQMNVSDVAVTMPRLKMDHKMTLSPVLAGMGICNVFIPNQAELTKISFNEQNLYVSDMIHQATLEVNERGTVASAATSTTATRHTPKQFRATRPFMFLIRDNDHGTPLFVGRVVRPTPF